MHTLQTPFGEPEYLVLAGSRLSGVNTPTSDYDYIGALVEPESYRLGLLTHTQGKHHQLGFEQHETHGPEFEGTVYSLWKLVLMFAECNPTILSLLYAEPLRDDFGINTPEFRRLVVSKKAGHRFMKYMEAQRKSMIGQRKHVSRQALVDAHGYDTKFAGHIVRLGLQGIEYLKTGWITLPMSEADRTTVTGIRAGFWTQEYVLEVAEYLEEELQEAYDACTLPDEPDYEALSDWLAAQYHGKWFAQAVRNHKEPGQRA